MTKPKSAIAKRGVLGCVVALGLVASTACRTPNAGCQDPAYRVEAWRANGVPGRHFSTEHFDIYSTLPDTICESAVPKLLEAAYRRFAATLPPRREAKLTTYIFGRRSEWTQFTRQRFPDRLDVYERIRRGGFTEGSTSVSFYVSRSLTAATLVHEAWHQYVAAEFDEPLPAWLNEGLACYHEAIDLAGDSPRFTPEHNTFRMATLSEAVRRNALLTLRELVDTNAGEVLAKDDERFTQTYYAQAWALIVFLRHGAGGRYAADFDRLMRDVSDGAFRKRVSAAALTERDEGATSDGSSAFVAYFDRPPADLQREYFDHLVRVTRY